ncbi:hypothetical protein Avbf_15689 [Armadillidium vulgare]|nr:hypothetical protein Avbf_15689 [Armadillidium vulgare]
MKFSAEILLTVLMGSLLCFQLALAQCDNSACDGKKGCCCPETDGCYFYMNSTVTNYLAAEALCDTLDRPLEGFDVSLPEGSLENIPIVMDCKVSFTFICIKKVENVLNITKVCIIN